MPIITNPYMLTAAIILLLVGPYLLVKLYFRFLKVYKLTIKNTVLKSLIDLGTRYQVLSFNNAGLTKEELETSLDFMLLSQFGLFGVKFYTHKNPSLVGVVIFKDRPTLDPNPKYYFMHAGRVASFISEHRGLLLGVEDINTMLIELGVTADSYKPVSELPFNKK